MQKQRPDPRAGQSIIEVLVATAVGTTMIVAAVSLISPALRGNQDVSRIQAGAAMAKETIEQVRVWAESDWHNVFNLSTSSANTYFIVPGTAFRVATGTESVLTVPANGLVGHWKLDETTGTSYFDYTGAYHATSSGGPVATSSCRLGASCLYFDGTDDYVDTPDDSTSLGGGQFSFDDAEDWSVSARYKGTQAGCGSGNTTETILGRDDNDLYANFGLCDGKAAYAHYNGAWLQIRSNTSVNDNNWHHLAYVNHSNATGDIYVDGVLETTDSSALSASDRRFVINNFMRGFSASYTAGYLDDARVYDRALTPDEIETIFRASPFYRNFYLDSVNRDGSDVIAAGAGTYDPSTLKITVNYNWEGGTATNTMTSYLVRAANKIYEQTDWWNGAGEDGPVTSTKTKFATSSNMDWTSSPGSIQVDL